MFGIVCLCGALLLCRADGRRLTGDDDGPAEAGARPPRRSPCLADDVLAALRESLGEGGGVANQSLTQFGICASGGGPADPLLASLRETRRRNWVLHPTTAPVSEDAESGTLWLTFDLPPSAPLQPSPLLLLPLAGAPPAEGVRVTFGGRPLQPDTQDACVSAGTLYVILTGRPAHADRTWRISARAPSPAGTPGGGGLRELLVGGKPGNAAAVPLLLFSGESGNDARAAWQTPSFVCELRRFLAAVEAQGDPAPPLLRLGSLRSRPPLTLGRSTAEAALAGLIRSPALVVLSLGSSSPSSPSPPPPTQGELALSPPLSEELRQRLEEAVTHVTGAVGGEAGEGRGALRSLGRLVELSGFLGDDPATGQDQYRALLLLKALQTAGRSLEVKRAQRAARADPAPPPSGPGPPCALSSFTMSLERHVIGPSTAAINNCRGACSFPMANATNHAALLSSYLEDRRAGGQGADQRPPCCVPVAYEDLDMVLLDAAGTGAELRTLTDVVVKECGCR